MRRVSAVGTLILLLPLLAVSALALALNDLVYLFLVSWWRRPSRRAANSSRNVELATIIVLNWNGRALLEECLPSVIAAVEHDGGEHEILVVDNGSTDDSREFLGERFPQVSLLTLPKNCFFGGGNNAGARAAKHDIVVFLNNDMRVDEGFLRPLLEPFSSDDVFAVSSQIFLEDTRRPREETGNTRATWRHGWIEYRHDAFDENDAAAGYSPIFWMGGGSSAVDRRKFLQIGGFDPLYHPFYVEDADVSYQAWKRGWRILFCPQSHVIHKHRASSSRFGLDFVERTTSRNQLIFIWKNITGFRLFLAHLASLPLVYLRLADKHGALNAVRVVAAALGRLPATVIGRNRQRRHYVRSDAEIFETANDPWRYRERFISGRIVQRGGPLKILFTCPYLPSETHFGGEQMLSLMRRLSPRHEVSALTFFESEAERRYLPELEKLCRRVVAVRRYPYAPAQGPLRLLPWQISAEFGAPEMAAAIQEALAADDYDIIQCEYLQMAYLMPRLKRPITILKEHEVQHAALWKKLRMQSNPIGKLAVGAQWLKWLQAEIALCRKFDRIIAVTREDRRMLTMFDRSLKVDVIEAAIDTDYFQPQNVSEEENSLIYVGAYRHYPNVDAARHLVGEILPLVRKVIPNVKLYLVGSAGSTELPPDVIREEGVVVTDWVEDIRPWLARASLCVFPIRLGVGIRGKILQAWAMGKPVIASQLACAGLDARHGENVWVANSPHDFAQGIVSLLKSTELRSKLAANARRPVVEGYGLQPWLERYEHVYYDALAERGRLLA